jgi:hypothetical protein
MVLPANPQMPLIKIFIPPELFNGPGCNDDGHWPLSISSPAHLQSQNQARPQKWRLDRAVDFRPASVFSSILPF